MTSIDNLLMYAVGSVVAAIIATIINSEFAPALPSADQQRMARTPPHLLDLSWNDSHRLSHFKEFGRYLNGQIWATQHDGITYLINKYGQRETSGFISIEWLSHGRYKVIRYDKTHGYMTNSPLD